MSVNDAQTKSLRKTRLGEVAEFIMGQAPPGDASNFDGYGTIFVKAGEFGPTHPIVREWTTKPLRFSKAGDVLICVVGATAGKLNLGIDSAIGRSVAAIRPNAETFDRFIYLQLQPKVLELRAGSTGSAQGVINRKMLANIEIILPPLDEQRRIVAEIEKQFTRLEAGVSALKRVQANLKRYRAAVLKAACEGKLVPTEVELCRKILTTESTEDHRGRKSETPCSSVASVVKNGFETGEELLERILEERRKNWLESNQQSKIKNRQYREPAAPDIANLPPLPEGWTWATVQQLNLANRPCAYGVLQPGEDVPDGVPFVRVGDINNGKVELANMKRISTAIAAQYPRTKLHGGELAITLVGAIGRTAIIPDSLAGGNTARAVGIIPLTKQVNAQWVEIWFRNPAKNAEMDSKSHEVARKTLNLEDVRVASVTLPPLAEQTRIVAEVERRLSTVEELEAVVSANLQRAGRLRQSILQKAFSGELV